ncbi:glycoside hydrolase family 19 protein [Synechococcus sp. W55.2]|uniref:glycoside hydrolase family 19 protein n=1 Tax=Synechococcus sp. W55.2 TaxID=2964513 RepID=UPI0039C1554A
MDNFNILDVPRWYRDLPHQREALEWLWSRLSEDDRREFVRRWRAEASAPPVQNPQPVVTLAQLRALFPFVPRPEQFLDSLNEALARYQITTPLRAAHFLGQVGHETGGLRWLEEIWGPTPAQRGYEGRRDLGNTQPGDGYRFRGRGLFQLTGRANYERFARAVGQPQIIENPDLVATPYWAAQSAGWFWHVGNRTGRSLNALADRDDLRGITLVINGGLNGLEDRRLWTEKAKRVLHG